MESRQSQTPRGARDYLPEQAGARRWLEAEVRKVFEGYGYSEVITPTFEYVDALMPGAGEGVKASMIRFFDREGESMALRADWTTPIARMVGTRFVGSPRPLRLYYQGQVFRHEDPQAGRQREFTQAGVELIGASSSQADAEIISLALETFNSIGLEDFRLDLGQVGFVQGLLEEANLPKSQAWEVRSALVQRDQVLLSRLAGSLPSHVSEALLELPRLRGGREILTRARELAGNPRSLAAVANLEEIADELRVAGLEARVTFDLSIVRDLAYYTGLVLEGYTSDLGLGLCTGGRYDGLLSEYGEAAPATGFAMGVERSLLALERRGVMIPTPSRPRILAWGGSALTAIVEQLRQQGLAVIGHVSQEDPQETAQAHQIPWILRGDGQGLFLSRFTAGGWNPEEAVTVEQILKKM